jgi:hypothetical protein
MTNEIFSVIDLLKAARQSESECGLALADARADVERRKAIALAEAYQSGQIDGKNAETRKVQEAQLLETSQPVHAAALLERQLETKHTAARIEREYQADRYRAMLALLGVPIQE